MSSGWGCQYLGKKDNMDDWCLKLSHKCDPGCKGCIIYGQVDFSKPSIDEEQSRKVKKRSDNPLER